MATFYIKETDLSPAIQTTLCDPAGVAIDVTGQTVTFQMTRLGSDTKAVNAAASLITPASGIVRYTFLDTETDNPGVYKAQWIVDLGLTTQETYPNQDYDTVYIEWGL